MKKGFTLIELLAVIVILAIVALIATPIILGIIRDSKENANKRSIDNYAKAVENAIAKYQLDGKKINYGYYKYSEGGKLITLDTTNPSEEISLNIDYEGNPVLCDIIKFNEDNTIHLNKCKVNGDFVYYEYGTTDYLCVASKELTTEGVGYIKDPKDPYKLGTEYICKVNENQQYTFYVLSVEEDKVNLIMDRNILSTGEGTTSDNVNSSNNYGRTYWISPEDYKNSNLDKTNCSAAACTDEGPITAMNYLYEATKDWSFIPNINIIYNDEGTEYSGIYTDNNTTFIKNSNDNISRSYVDLKARLPITKELKNTGCSQNSLSCPSWLKNGLNRNQIEGYWTFTTTHNKYNPFYDLAYYVKYTGQLSTGGYCCTTIYYNGFSGIRPVINVSYLDIN